MIRRMLNLALFALVCLLAAFLVVALWLSWTQARLFVYPPRTFPAADPAAYGLSRWQEVRFTTTDGLTLAGWLILPEQAANGRALLAIHGHGGNRDFFLPQAAFLARQGYAVLLFDLRNHGASEGTVTTMGLLEVRDVRAAFAFLQAQPGIDPAQIVLLGHSMGGATALQAMAELPQARAVITDTAYTSVLAVTRDGITTRTGLPPLIFGEVILSLSSVLAGSDYFAVRPVDVIGSIAPRPVLLIHGTQDATIPVAHSQALYAAAGSPKDLWLVPGGAHNDLYALAAGDYERRLLTFLDALDD
ncbi:MAG: alpha/beta fold hydrolase [Anaerolineae bacterium]|nr:alpha/beta fold hydrolase [Anaerolineae bacterium]